MPAQADQFWDVKARERDEESALRREITLLETELTLAQRSETIRHAAGWDDFVKSVESLRDTSKERLVADKTLTNDGLREERGRTRAFEQILILMTRTKVVEPLALRLAERKNELAALRRPKPKPEAST